MDLYVRQDHLDEALAIFKAIYAETPDFVLTSIKTFSLATSLLKSNRTEDAFMVLEHLNKESDGKQENVRMDIFAWRLIDVAANRGDVELTTKLFDVVQKAGFKITGLLAGPLVKVHTIRYIISIHV